MAINKSTYLNALVCVRRAYFAVKSPELGAATTVADRLVMQQGREIGKLARSLFVGVLVETPSTDMDRAAAETRRLMDEGANCLFEAAFTDGEVTARVDILEPDQGGWHLIEVKSSKSLKPEHVSDVAFQMFALERCGIRVARASLMHLSDRFLSGQPARELFRTEDITEAARLEAADIALRLESIRGTIESDEVPEVVPNRHCFGPDCAFIGVCYDGLPKYDATTLPRLSADKIDRLHADGRRDIREIPEDMLTARQRLIQGVVCSGTPFVDPGLRGALDSLVWPIRFVDFESDNPALPTVPGLPAYEAVPFQWSMHVLFEDGVVEHKQFLHTARSDPRVPFVRSLGDSLGDEGTIAYYSAFEVTRLRQLMKQGIGGAQAVLDEFEKRGCDLMKIVERHVYDAEFMGQTSIKRVLPSLVPGLSYGDLEIQDGSTAAAEFRRMLSSATVEHEAKSIAQSLLRYCERDTLAMLKIFEALRAMAKG